MAGFFPETEKGDASITAVAQRVSDVLRDKIVKGDYPPGARLVERKMSAELDVSRTPVREALKLLEADGLIGISRNKGAQVLAYDAAEARALFEVLSALESLAAQKLAETISIQTLDKLEDLHAHMLRHFRETQVQAYFDINSLIHDTIVTECGNALLCHTHKRLIARARRGRFMAIMDPARLAQAVAEHETLMEALRQRDPELAGMTWRTHLLHTGKAVAKCLQVKDDADLDTLAGPHAVAKA